MKINPKKSLGQNFLIDQNIIKKIINVADIEGKNILEVGPGTGNLTKKIIESRPSKVTVIEKDETLCKFLKEQFNDQIEIINKDILIVDENRIFTEPLIVFGNLPYNISTEILLKWISNLKTKPWFNELILMFQKEVADRIISKKNTSSYGRLSIISQWKFEIKKIIDIKPSCFYPKPKIESTLLHFLPKENYADLNCKELELLTKTFFNHRRKMIKKPVTQLFKDPSMISKKFNLDLSLRPQNLSQETYYELAKNYKKLRR